jgi:hypothetical protein
MIEWMKNREVGWKVLGKIKAWNDKDINLTATEEVEESGQKWDINEVN